jgi:hypothetical protein
LSLDSTLRRPTSDSQGRHPATMEALCLRLPCAACAACAAWCEIRPAPPAGRAAGTGAVGLGAAGAGRSRPRPGTPGGGPPSPTGSDSGGHEGVGTQERRASVINPARPARSLVRPAAVLVPARPPPGPSHPSPRPGRPAAGGTSLRAGRADRAISSLHPRTRRPRVAPCATWPRFRPPPRLGQNRSGRRDPPPRTGREAP